MPIFSLLYGSLSLLAPADEDRAIADIVRVSQTWNRDHAITGVLISAAGRFAQLLEGDEAEVRLLMARIVRDSRHSGVEIALEERRAQRHVPAWNMAYAGPSTFVAGHIAPLHAAAAPPERRRAARRLIALMVAFTQEPPGGTAA